MNALTSLIESERFATFLILLVAVLLSTTGELFLKAGMNQVGEIGFSLADLVRVFASPRILTGFALFGVGALFWLAVLARAELSWAYPMLAMGYLLVVLESRYLFSEHVSPQRWIGALVIVAGVVIMYGSAPKSP